MMAAEKRDDLKPEFRFLPLGTFVNLEDRGDQIFMVVARALGKDGEHIYSRYRIVEHPAGDLPNVETELEIVNDDLVTKIVQIGFENEEDAELLASKLEAARKASSSKPRADIPEPDFANLLQETSKVLEAAKADAEAEAEREEMRKNPFYKLMKIVAAEKEGKQQ